MTLVGEPFIRGLSINLPVLGTADSPTACKGDLRFDNPRTKLLQRECAAVCARCPWLEQCRDTAQMLLDAGEKLWGVWGGRCYAIDNDQVTSVTNLLDHGDTRFDRSRSSEGGRSYGGKRPARRHERNVSSGRPQENVDGLPTAVVRLSRVSGTGASHRGDSAVREGAPPRLRLVR